MKKRHDIIDVYPNTMYDASSILLTGIIKTADNDYNQSICICPSSGIKQKPRCLNEDCCDAVILIANLNEKLDAEIDRLQTPVVRLNCNTYYHKNCINYDEKTAIDLIFNKLYERGRKNVLMFISESAHYSQMTRHSAALNNKYILS